MYLSLPRDGDVLFTTAASAQGLWFGSKQVSCCLASPDEECDRRLREGVRRFCHYDL
jgi:hypothetical protein